MKSPKFSGVTFGVNVKVYEPANLYGCQIGDDSKVGAFVEIQKKAKIGKRVKISSHTFICEGVVIEDDVFVGHNVSFINDKYPQASRAGKLLDDEDWDVIPTLVKRGASIGTSSTILCGVIIGEKATVGAGSVVTRNVPPNATVAGNPAQIIKKKKPSSDARSIS